MNPDDLNKMEEYFESLPSQGLEIPKKFHSVYSGKPFDACVDCGRNVLDPPCLYEIQKVYKGKETIFEYALCTECGKQLARQYSKESMESLENFFLENYLPSVTETSCHLCRGVRQKSPFDEYTTTALCKGDRLIMSFIMCQSCMEKLEGLLSEKTRKTMGDFIENKFPGIPAEFTPVPVLQI